MKIDVILDTRAKPQELAELGRLAERFGLHGVWVSSLLDSRDPFANLALLAQSSTRIRLGPIAVNPFDTHPVKIASALLTLNEMAGGRAQIVIGGGGEALQALGIRPDRRVRAVREAVEIIRAAASGERVTYAGELYRVSNLQLRWLESAPPRILVGASQQQMLRMAAGCADGIMMSDMPPTQARAAHRHAGRGPRRTRAPPPRFSHDRLHGLARLHRIASRLCGKGGAGCCSGVFSVPGCSQSFWHRTTWRWSWRARPRSRRPLQPAATSVDGVPDRILDALVDNVTISGSPENLEPVLAKLRHFKDAGLGGIALRLYADPAASIRLIGERIIPAL